MDKKEKEKQERLARGDPVEPTPKRRGRKPRTPEEKAAIKAAMKEAKKKNRVNSRMSKKKEKLMEKQRAKEERQRKKKEREEKKKERAEKRQRPETEEEREAKANARKAKYEEFKRAKVEKAEKRKQRNEELRIYRKKKKDEEKKQREAYEKRMQELKASFLDETSHLSATSQQVIDFQHFCVQNIPVHYFLLGRLYVDLRLWAVHVKFYIFVAQWKALKGITLGQILTDS